MAALLRDPFIVPLEEERQKFNSSHHEPTIRQLKRFGRCAHHLKQNPESLKDKKKSSRSREKIAREILSEISSLSSSIFVLCCFRVALTELSSKSYLAIIPKIREWWKRVEHPKALADKARDLCEIEGIRYVETGKLPGITVLHSYVHKFTTMHAVNTSENHEDRSQNDPTNSSDGPVLLYRDEIPMLQVSLLASEPPYQAIDLTIRQLINFLLACENLSDPQAVVSLLQQYESRCPTLKLKMPFFNAFPSVEMKVTSDFGSSVCLLFAWELANDLVFSLGFSPNTAN